MTNDLAKTIAAACLDHIQARPDSPSVDELADVVRPLLPHVEWDLAEGPSVSETLERVYDGTGWVYRRANADSAKRIGGYTKSPCLHASCGSTNAFTDPFSGRMWCLDCGRASPPKTPEAGDGE